LRRVARRALAVPWLAGLALWAGAARAQTGAGGAPLPSTDEAPPADDTGNDSAGYTPPADGPGAPSAVLINGYVDVGYARAQGDGTSFQPNDTRIPADYGVDPFAPAVNSSGDVASTEHGDRTVNGFLPRSVGIGGRPSFLLNVVAVDFKYTSPSAPLTIFTRVLGLPRFSAAGDATRFLVEQAFGRIIPFDSLELALAVGKFDSVFGIEYLDNESNIRTGITPSLIARYTTGQSLGAKLFYRLQLAPLWSAVSLNVAATNQGTFVESLQTADASLTGVPVATARLGYELNLPHVQLKAGASGAYGPRNDQSDRGALMQLHGVDFRLALFGLYLNAEAVQVDEDPGAAKTTPTGPQLVASGFHARGFYAQLAYALALDAGPLHKVTPYARYEQRQARFEGFDRITVDRITAGVRVELWDALIVKGEWLVNRELAGAPNVPNNVQTASVVYSW
jgi:hypothetical protein